MPWRESVRMDERMKFVVARLKGSYTMAELCRRYEISRETGYKLMRRYEAEGAAGLMDRSHAPHTCPHRVSEEVEQAILAAKKAHMKWGAKKLRDWLLPRRRELELPAASTMNDLLARHGLVRPRQRRSPPKLPLVHTGLTEGLHANHVWTIDFKGEFRTGDGWVCYPLTVQDHWCRFLLAAHGLGSTGRAGARQVLERVFRERGLPEVIRTDNGGPFVAMHAWRGLSRLTVWWIKLGIRHERTRLATPSDNPRHERMHRTLKDETARPPGKNRAAQQVLFDRFRAEYNEERPHDALGGDTPGSWYTPAPRPYPTRLAAPEYAGHCELRRVSSGGDFLFRGRSIFLSATLEHETIALEEVEDGIWDVSFYDLQIARLNERTGELSG
jgi:putative transposase